MGLSLENVRKNFENVLRRIEETRVQAGWDHVVRVVAATKYVSVDDMDVVRQAGITLVGENRANELQGKWQRYGEDFEFHFIGHVQRRKVPEVLPCVTMIHSVDSIRLVRALDSRAVSTVDVLLQVNISGEGSKYGILPADAEAFLREATTFDKVRFCGFMTMAPLVSDPEEARGVFAGLRVLRDRLAPLFASRYELTELSMGMSNDYEVAVGEGATLVRLGSTLFSGSEGG